MENDFNNFMINTEPENEMEINRIKKRINNLTTGALHKIINYAISSLVTLEISNGVEKITIQQIVKELQKRLLKLNEYLDELILNKNNITEFKNKIYKLFSLTDLLKIIISKCVSMNFAISRILNMFTKSIDIASNKLIDDIFFTHTDQEYSQYIESLIDERFDYLPENELKYEKIKFLTDILSQYVGIEIELNQKSL